MKTFVGMKMTIQKTTLVFSTIEAHNLPFNVEHRTSTSQVKCLAFFIRAYFQLTEINYPQRTECM